MKLSDIVAELKALKETVTGFISDKTKATTDALTSFSAKLTTLETGAVSELTSAQAALAEEKGRVTALTGEKSSLASDLGSIDSALAGAATALKIEFKADATRPQKISALQGAVSETLAKLNIDPAKIPANKPVSTASGDVKKMTRAEFQAIAPRARMEYLRNGGKVTD